MSTALAVPRSADQNSKRKFEEPQRQKVRFNRAVLKLSPEEAREWPEQTLRVAEEDELEEAREISSPALDATHVP